MDKAGIKTKIHLDIAGAAAQKMDFSHPLVQFLDYSLKIPILARNQVFDKYLFNKECFFILFFGLADFCTKYQQKFRTAI